MDLEGVLLTAGVHVVFKDDVTSQSTQLRFSKVNVLLTVADQVNKKQTNKQTAFYHG